MRFENIPKRKFLVRTDTLWDDLANLGVATKLPNDIEIKNQEYLFCYIIWKDISRLRRDPLSSRKL
jgi:hypothetical protein